MNLQYTFSPRDKTLLFMFWSAKGLKVVSRPKFCLVFENAILKKIHLDILLEISFYWSNLKLFFSKKVAKTNTYRYGNDVLWVVYANILLFLGIESIEWYVWMLWEISNSRWRTKYSRWPPKQQKMAVTITKEKYIFLFN